MSNSCCFTPPPAQFWGQYHNAGIDFIWEEFNRIPRVAVLSPTNIAHIQTTLLLSLSKFVKVNFPNIVEQSSNATTEVINILLSDVNVFQNYAFNNIFFSAASTPYLMQLQAALNGQLSPQNFEAALDAIYQDVISDALVPSREAEQLTCFLQIGIYSSEYWNNVANQNKWATLFTNNPNPNPPNYLSIGGADVAGAVGGAVRFGVAALFGGPVGWGACAVASLSTGIAASVIKAVF